VELVKQIERSCVSCSLPKVLSNATPVGNKRHKERGGPDPKRPKPIENKKQVVNTEMIVEAWKLSREEEANFRNMFDYPTLLKRPDHSSGCKLCHKWAVRKYCFSDCNNKGSHGSWSTSEKSKFDSFIREVRNS